MLPAVQYLVPWYVVPHACKMSMFSINTQESSPGVVERQRASLDEDRDGHKQPGHSDDSSDLEAEVYIGGVSARRLRRVLTAMQRQIDTETANIKK